MTSLCIWSWRAPSKEIRSYLPLTALMFHSSIYAFFTLKKAFTPSHNARFAMSIIGFECEGLDFKVFTAQELIRPLISWFSSRFPVWRLAFSTLHKLSHRYEAFKRKNLHTQTSWKSAGNTHHVKEWMLFSGNKKPYIRARETGNQSNRFLLFQPGLHVSLTQPNSAWSFLYKSPTIFHNSTCWQNNSGTWWRHIIIPSSITPKIMEMNLLSSSKCRSNKLHVAPTQIACRKKSRTPIRRWEQEGVVISNFTIIPHQSEQIIPRLKSFKNKTR